MEGEIDKALNKDQSEQDLFQSAIGCTIDSAFEDTIANAIDSWGGGYGYHIKISHNDTFDTLYAHCSSICVTVGQEVKQGEVIGYVGTTGNSTGNHLHFEVWQNGERTDALGYFKAKG